MNTHTNQSAQKGNVPQGGKRVLQPTDISPFQSILSCHNRFLGRPTIVPIIVCNDKVLLVKSAKSGTWSLPQGGIKMPKDETLMLAALREGHEELQLEERHLVFSKRQMIGEYPNPIPKDRGLEFDNKHMFLIALSVHKENWVRLNEENQEFSWVSSFDELVEKISTVAEERWVKFQATCEAIGEMCKVDLLSWQVEPQRPLAFA